MTKKERSNWDCGEEGGLGGWYASQKCDKHNHVKYSVQVYGTTATSNQIIYSDWMHNWPQITTTLNANYANYYNVYAQLAGTPASSLIYDYTTLITGAETAEQTAKRLKEKAERAAAEHRAQNLLFTILTPSQVKQYTDDSYFEIEVNGRTYRLNKRSYSRNVELIVGGKVKEIYCAHPSDAHVLPVPDTLLAQMLMLKSDEQGFLRVANRTVVQ